MKNKIFVVILALVLVVVLASCGSYIPPVESQRPGSNGSGNGSGNKPGGGTGEKPGDEEIENGYTFTVTLLNAPENLSETIEAVWTGENEQFSAPFVNGVATAEGLDGDYTVTLSEVPTSNDGRTEYTYDRSNNKVDNFNRDYTIELLEIIRLTSFNTLTPSGENKSIRFYTVSKYGTYRATLTSENDLVGFMFEPKENGLFSVTSWCDVTENKINPTIRLYNGHQNFCVFSREIRDGGTSNTFTKNFRYAPENGFADENIGGVLIFAVTATVNGLDYSKDDVYVDFTIKRESSYEAEDITGTPRYATGPYYTGSTPTGTWRYIYRDQTKMFNGHLNYIQDEDMVVFNPSDGFYHVGTLDGPLLYAKLTLDAEVFATIDGPPEVWINKGFFWNDLAGGKVNLSINGWNYSYMINEGYANYCNSDGAHPVNKEIKDFLQGYASREMYFRDGEGWAEDGEVNANSYTNPGGLYLQSDENSMWLFVCGYYN